MAPSPWVVCEISHSLVRIRAPRRPPAEASVLEVRIAAAGVVAALALAIVAVALAAHRHDHRVAIPVVVAHVLADVAPAPVLGDLAAGVARTLSRAAAVVVAIPAVVVVVAILVVE